MSARGLLLILLTPLFKHSSSLTLNRPPQWHNISLPKNKMKIPDAELWWEQPKLRDGAGVAPVTTIEILFQRHAAAAASHGSAGSRPISHRAKGWGQVRGYTITSNSGLGF